MVMILLTGGSLGNLHKLVKGGFKDVVAHF